MFNVGIKHMNKVLNCYKTYEVEEDIYLCFRMLQSREVKEDKKSSSLCNYIFQP